MLNYIVEEKMSQANFIECLSCIDKLIVNLFEVEKEKRVEVPGQAEFNKKELFAELEKLTELFRDFSPMHEEIYTHAKFRNRAENPELSNVTENESSKKKTDIVESSKRQKIQEKPEIYNP